MLPFRPITPPVSRTAISDISIRGFLSIKETACFGNTAPPALRTPCNITFIIRNLGAFFCGPRDCKAIPRAAKKPGFPLQFLVRASRALRDFRFNPLRGRKSLPQGAILLTHVTRGQKLTADHTDYNGLFTLNSPLLPAA
jgi:hypothetical protein